MHPVGVLNSDHTLKLPKVPLILYIIYRSDLHDMHWYSAKLLRNTFLRLVMEKMKDEMVRVEDVWNDCNMLF